MKHFFLLLIFFLFCQVIFAQTPPNTKLIKVHFKHGSVPKKQYKRTEYKELGGKWGGHVLVEIGDSVYDFAFWKYELHLFPRKKKCIGKFSALSLQQFHDYYQEERVTSFVIPVADSQYQVLLAHYNQCIDCTPYDYAFCGMRCTASCMKMLADAGILPPASYSKAIRKAFYPKPFRKKLRSMAKKNGWKIEFQKGTDRRKWEG